MTTACVDFGLGMWRRLTDDPHLSEMLRYVDENGEFAYRIHRNHVPDWGEDGEAWSDACASAAAAGNCLDLNLPPIPSWIWFQMREVQDSGCINSVVLPDYVTFDFELVTQSLTELETMACRFENAIRLPGIEPEMFGNIRVDEVIVAGVSDTYEPKSMRGADWGFHWRGFDVQIMPIAVIEEGD